MNDTFFSQNYKNIAISSLYGLSVLSLVLMLFWPAAASRIGIEDGPIENLSALFLLGASAAMAVHGIRLLRARGRSVQLAVLALVMSVAFFVFAGEEISWGQRIFNIETGEFMQQYNWQNEVNLHNLHTDISNIGFHYGALLFFIILPLFREQVLQLLKKLRVEVLGRFIPPTWFVAPSFVFLGMLDSRFVYTIEKPWAAAFYLLALAVGLALLLWRLKESLRLKNTAEAWQLGLSLALIAAGLYVAYVYAVDEQATNIISEYKEFVIAVGLFLFTLQWRANDNRRLQDPSTARES